MDPALRSQKYLPKMYRAAAFGSDKVTPSGVLRQMLGVPKMFVGAAAAACTLTLVLAYDAAMQAFRACASPGWACNCKAIP